MSVPTDRDLDLSEPTVASGDAPFVRRSSDPIKHEASPSGPRVSMPMTSAPPTPWNKTVSPHRRFAMRSTSLENLKRLKEATGGTLNDVVMAVCATGTPLLPAAVVS